MRTILRLLAGLVSLQTVLAWDTTPETGWAIVFNTNAVGYKPQGATWTGTTEFNLTSPHFTGQYVAVDAVNPRRYTVWVGPEKAGHIYNRTMLAHVNTNMVYDTNAAYNIDLNAFPLGNIPHTATSNTLPIAIFGRVPDWVTLWEPGNGTNPVTYTMDLELSGNTLRDIYNTAAPGSTFRRIVSIPRATNLVIGEHLRLHRKAVWRDGTGGPWVTNIATWYPRQWSVGLIVSNARGTNGQRIASYQFPNDHYRTGLGDE